MDLGHIDLLVQDGFYANRTDFIRTAIRNQIERHAEAARAAGRPLDIRVLGLATIADDVSPELARQTIASVEVLGAFRASSAVKAALATRIV